MMTLKHICVYALLLLSFVNNASQQPDFSLINNAKEHPLTDADFILLTLALREQFEKESNRSYFSTQPIDYFTSKGINISVRHTYFSTKILNKNEQNGLKTLQKYYQKQTKEAKKTLLQKRRST